MIIGIRQNWIIRTRRKFNFLAIFIEKFENFEANNGKDNMGWNRKSLFLFRVFISQAKISTL